MIENSKGKTVNPDVVEHMAMENERLRGLLRELREITSEYAWDADLEARVDAALSKQAEPTDTFTAVDMATAAAQGFRDGQAAVEPAPAQDEREAFNAEYDRICNRPLTMREIAWRMWQARAARPAQTEQQPLAFRVLRRNHDGIWTTDGRAWLDGVPDADLLGDIAERSDQWRLEYAYAAPIAQTAPQPEQSGLVEAASGALAAIQDALEDAYHNAYPECCGQAHLECCGSPLQAWSEADQKTMERFTPHEEALRAALSAQGAIK